MLKLADCETDSDEKPLYPHKIIKTEVCVSSDNCYAGDIRENISSWGMIFRKIFVRTRACPI